MPLKTFFTKLLPGKRGRGYSYARMLDGSIPVFSSFGRDIYASDVVQAAINRKALEVSKAQPRHIRTMPDETTTQPRSDFNRLFKFGPNPVMTTSEFLEKIIWLLDVNYNCFIYPAYEIVRDGRGGPYRRYTGFYPLDPTTATFLQDDGDNLHVEMAFRGGDTFTLPYDEVIHLRKKFSANDILGGGRNGRPDNDSILKVLEVEHTVLEGLQKAIPASLNIRGILKINTMLDDEKQEAERKRFEEAMARGKTGILAMDIKGDYFPLNIDPKIIDKDTMAFLQEKILNWVGVPAKFLSGDFTGDDYQVWHEQELEPIMIRMGQAFSKVLFTENELNHGNEIVFYQRDFMYMSFATRLRLLEVAGGQGVLYDNDKRKLINHSPFEGDAGKRRTQSLNFISADIADEYQMRRAKALKGTLGDDDKKQDDDNKGENDEWHCT